MTEMLSFFFEGGFAEYLYRIHEQSGSKLGMHRVGCRSGWAV